MFENSNLLALMQEKPSDGELVIRHIALEEETRKGIVDMFSRAATSLICRADGTEKTPQSFHADYTAQVDADEYIEISPFVMPDDISSAILDPLSLETYVPDQENLPLIRALFVGESIGDSSFRIAFQRFKNAQYLKASNIHIQFSSDTLVNPEIGKWAKWSSKVGLTVAPLADAFFDNGALCFVSAYYAKQILDLTDYYKEATKPELEEFVQLDGIEVEVPDYIVNDANSWERRKIASIRNARIIEEHPLDEMRGLAHQLDYVLPEKDGKLVIPADRKERRKLFAFLDEDVYRGMFTEAVYETNSKRSV